MGIQITNIVKTKSAIEQIKLIVNIISLIKGIKISNTECLILTHFIIEGYNQVTKEKLIESGILKNKTTLANALSRLRKAGLLVQNNFKEELCSELNIKVDNVVLLKTLLDNR